MDEREQHESDRMKRAAELSAAGLGIVAVSAAMVLRHRRQEAKNIEHIRTTTPLIFEERRLSVTTRDIMARAAVRIYVASQYSPNGIITRETLTEVMGTKRYETQKALSYLMPAGKSETARAEAYIDRRKGLVESTGYYARPRLVELIETGQSDALEQAMQGLENGYDGPIVVEYHR